MAKRQFDYQGYPCAPIDLSDRAWFYIQKEGLIVCARAANGDPSEQAIIPWRMIKRVMADHEKAKGRKALVGNARDPS